METIKEELETNAEERLSETEENEERARSGNPGRGFQQVSDGSWCRKKANDAKCEKELCQNKFIRDT